MPRTASSVPYRLCKSTSRIAGVFMTVFARLRCHAASGPGVAAHQNLAVGGHARLREAHRALELEFDADDLLHAIVTEIRVLWREARFRIDPRDERINRLCG